MKIVNLSYQRHPEQSDPEKWIGHYGFFYGIWEEVGREHEVIFLEFIDADETLERAGISYHFQRRSRPGLLLPFALHRYIRKQRPDVVIVHGILFPAQVWLLRKALGKKVQIIQQHHAEKTFRYVRKYLQRMADRSIDAYWFTAYGLAKPWIEKGLIHKDKVKELMETTSAFGQIEKKAALSVTQAQGAPVYLWVGRLNANKDPLLLVAAFLRFAKQHPAAQLYMIYQEDELLPQIWRLLAEDPAAARQIHLVGRVQHEELAYWYNSADFIIACSRYEGSGVAVCEAMSCGCIPLVTAIPSFTYMTGEACGLLFPPGDKEALGAVLEASCTMDMTTERAKTLLQYNSRLSSQAIASGINRLLKARGSRNSA